jgi:hypothetical protein
MARIGLFSPSTDSAPLPGSAPVPAGTKPFSTDDLDTSQVQPAKSVQDLQAQIARLILVFEEHEGREPNPGDAEFWQAYNTLVQRFDEGYEVRGPAGTHD